MPSSSLFFAAVADSETGNGPVFYIILAIGLGLTAWFTRWAFARFSERAKRRVSTGTGDQYAIVIGPFNDFAQSLVSLRASVNCTGPVPKHGYKASILTVGVNGLTLSTLKAATLVAIPADRVVSVEAGSSTFAARGAITKITRPTLFLTVASGDETLTVPLVPFNGGYNPATPEVAAQFAAELNSRLAAVRAVSTSTSTD